LIRPKANFQKADCFNLTPISGNIHCFLALEDSIFLDILTPDYSEDKPCSFYSIVESEVDKHCTHCQDFKNRHTKEQDTEFIQILVDESLPSTEFKNIDLFEDHGIQKC
jgi:hypothetical protein